MLSKTQIKYILSLKAAKFRDMHGMFVAEGPRLISELSKPSLYKLEVLYATEQSAEKLNALFGAPIAQVVDAYLLAQASLLKSPHDCLALLRLERFPFLPFPENGWSLVLDNIQDPGNLGTLIRIADWFGLRYVYASQGTADCFNPKAVQASMGSLFRTRVMYGEVENWVKQTSLPVLVADATGESVYDFPATQAGILVVGNEGAGVGEAFRKQAKAMVSIPRIGDAESLNAAVATGILLSHLLPKPTYPIS